MHRQRNDEQPLDGALLVSIRRTAAALGTGETYVRRLLKEKKLEGRKLGRRHLVTVASIKALAEGDDKPEPTP